MNIDILFSIISYWGSYISPVVISYFLIYVFYNIFKTRWPELYFSNSDYASLYISFSPLRYFAFRLLPILIIVTMILGVFGKNISQSVINFLGISVGLFHALSTHGLALIKLLLNAKSIHTYFNKYFQLIFHFLSIIPVVLVAWFAAYISKTDFVLALIPTRVGLVDNLWSSFITALIAVYLYNIYKGQNVDSEEIFSKSYKSLNTQLIKYIEEYCKEKMADVRLVLAICVVENIQRPSWVRKLERIKSFVFKKGSYGIMQVQSKKYLNDKESVKLAVDNYFAGHPNYRPDSLDIRRLVERYNKDERYVDLVLHAYHYQHPILG